MTHTCDAVSVKIKFAFSFDPLSCKAIGLPEQHKSLYPRSSTVAVLIRLSMYGITRNSYSISMSACFSQTPNPRQHVQT